MSAVARCFRSEALACRAGRPPDVEDPERGPMALALNIGKCSLLGNYRENNEDSIEVKLFPDLTVSIVADGMGGQAAGEIASKRAIEIIPRELRKNLAAHLNADGGEGGHPQVHRPGQRRDHGDGRPRQGHEEHGHDGRHGGLAQGDRDVRRRRRRQPGLPAPRRNDPAAHRRPLARPGARRGQDHLRRRGQGPPVQERAVEVPRQQGSRRGAGGQGRSRSRPATASCSAPTA